MTRIRFRVRWPWQETGRHWKLMLATTIVAIIVTPILWLAHSPTAAVAVVLWVLTLAVQWLCIEPPDVEEEICIDQQRAGAVAPCWSPPRQTRALRLRGPGPDAERFIPLTAAGALQVGSALAYSGLGDEAATLKWRER